MLHANLESSGDETFYLISLARDRQHAGANWRYLDELFCMHQMGTQQLYPPRSCLASLKVASAFNKRKAAPSGLQKDENISLARRQWGLTWQVPSILCKQRNLPLNPSQAPIHVTTKGNRKSPGNHWILLLASFPKKWKHHRALASTKQPKQKQIIWAFAYGMQRMGVRCFITFPPLALGSSKAPKHLQIPWQPPRAWFDEFLIAYSL